VAGYQSLERKAEARIGAAFSIFQACLLVSLAQGTRKKEGKGRIRMYRRREVHTHTGYIR
jgi:hypothetical protein